MKIDHNFTAMSDPTLPSELKRLIEAPPYHGLQGKFAAHVGLDLPAINRIVRGRVKASPAIVSKICGTLPQGDASAVLSAYLGDLAKEILASAPQRSAKVSVLLRQRRR